MALEYVTTAQQTVVAAAAATSFAASASTWANGAYVQLTASLFGDAYLVGVELELGVAAAYEVDIATGGAGSEVVRATFRASSRLATGNPTGWCPAPVPLDASFTSGSRVAVRGRVSGGGASSSFITAVFVAKPLTGSVKTTTNTLTALPGATTVTATQSATPWSNGSYAQVTASTAAATIVGALACNVVAATEAEIDLATGGAGSETVITTYRVRHIATTQDGGTGYAVMPCLLDNIPASTRVAVRARGSVASAAAYDVGLNTFAQSGF